jgi:hypothetical protein
MPRTPSAVDSSAEGVAEGLEEGEGWSPGRSVPSTLARQSLENIFTTYAIWDSLSGCVELIGVDLV